MDGEGDEGAYGQRPSQRMLKEMETDKYFYRDFEDTFRGPYDVIKERLTVYQDFIAPLKANYDPCEALDLGSGRGEWLEILGAMGVQARGIDHDEGMVRRCRERGFSVLHGDAVAYLRNCPDSSLALISGFHIAEHLHFASLRDLIQQALRALRPGGLLILETPNPDNLVSASSGFFIDPTHVRPLPDPLLRFLASYYGFARIKILRLQEAVRLHRADRVTLADVLGGASPDYGLIAQKASDRKFLATFDKAFGQERGLTTAELSAQYDAYQDRRWLRTAQDVSRMETRVADLEAQVRMLRGDVGRLETHVVSRVMAVAPIGGAQELRKALENLSRLTPRRLYRGCMRRARRAVALVFRSSRQQTEGSPNNTNLLCGGAPSPPVRPGSDPGTQRAPQRLLIVRGDLNSWSGYSRAIGAYVARLKDDYDRIIGIDIHAHPSCRRETWPYVLAGDDDIAAVLTSQLWDATILTISTPDRFRRWFGATNIGLFFWETTRINRPDWISSINTMDEAWAPAPFMVPMLKEEGVTVPIRMVPCPLGANTLCSSVVSGASILVEELRGSAGDSVRQVTLSSLRESAHYIFLATNSFIPRKGFPVLFQEWFSVARHYPESVLLVKVSSLDINETPKRLKLRLESLAMDIARQHDIASTQIYVYAGPLDPVGMAQMSQVCDAAISLSFGEGLGLGIFENLLADKPIICPRHTSFADYLPNEYPYFLETEIANVGLPDPADVYPISARWGFPVEGALLRAVQRFFADLEGGRLADVVDVAKTHFRAKCEAQWTRSAL